MKQYNVTMRLKAVADSMVTGDTKAVYNIYDMAMNQLATSGEKEAFKYGALAIFSDVGNMKIRRLWHTHQFRKALRSL